MYNLFNKSQVIKILQSLQRVSSKSFKYLIQGKKVRFQLYMCYVVYDISYMPLKYGRYIILAPKWIIVLCSFGSHFVSWPIHSTTM